MNLREIATQMHMGMPSEAPTAGKAAPTPQKSKGGALSHLKQAKKAHKAGDHKAAKSHAFGFIRALPKQHQPAPQAAPVAPASSPAPAGM